MEGEGEILPAMHLHYHVTMIEREGREEGMTGVPLDSDTAGRYLPLIDQLSTE